MAEQKELHEENSTETIYTEVPVAEQKSRNGFGKVMKKFFTFLFLLFSCVIFLTGLGSLLWFGGYAEDSVCENVKEGSTLWNKFSCANETEKQDEFVFEEKDQQNITVTDIEEVVTRIVEESADSVVGVGILSGTNLEMDRVVGSGFVVTANGLIATNQHVVADGDEEDFFVVIGEGSDPIPVTNIYRDELNDIALIKIDRTDLPVLPLGDSDMLKVGQTSIAIGNPLGDLSNTVTVGTISALNREVEVSDDSFRFSSRTHFGVIQTDAAINPGNSGGPLINSNGEVIGINFATISGADNLSFALPVNLLKQRIAELNEFGDFRIPFMGVEYQQRLVFFENKSLVGAVVARVVAGSPADRAGIVRSDIIVQYDGKNLEDNSLLNLIQRTPIGDTVEVIIIRNSESITVPVTIEDRNTTN